MSLTLFFDHINGTVEQIYPCRCGQTHRGPWATYDYGHHNCFHDEPLTAVDQADGHYMCPSCGKSFLIEPPAGPHQEPED